MCRRGGAGLGRIKRGEGTTLQKQGTKKHGKEKIARYFNLLV